MLVGLPVAPNGLASAASGSGEAQWSWRRRQRAGFEAGCRDDIWARVVGIPVPQALLDAHLFDLVKAQRRDLLTTACLQPPSGRPSKSKILAYLYQHDESEVMDIVREVAGQHLSRLQNPAASHSWGEP